ALGGIDRLLMSRAFSAPARGADLLDVHRALTEAAPLRHRFFIEFAQSPIFPAYAVTGVARAAVTLGAGGGAAALAKDMLALFPVEEGCGAPAKEALAAWRDVGGGPLSLRGGAVFRVRPGGAVEVYRLEAHVALENEQLHTVGVAPALDGRTVADHLAGAQQ